MRVRELNHGPVEARTEPEYTMYHSFMVRISRDEEKVADDLSIVLESIQNGRIHQFDNLGAMLEFLEGVIELQPKNGAGEVNEEKSD